MGSVLLIVLQAALSSVAPVVFAVLWRKEAVKLAKLQTLYTVAVARNKQLEAENGMVTGQLTVFSEALTKEAIKNASQDKSIAQNGDAHAVVDALVKRLQAPLGGVRTNRSTGHTAADVQLRASETPGTDPDKPKP